MKKKSMLSVLVACTLSVMNLSAQTKPSVGIKLNGNLTNLQLTGAQPDNKFKAGGTVGGFVQIRFHENFALQPELLFNYTETSIKWAGEKTKYKYAGVEIPVYALGKYAVGSGSFFLGVGPHIRYGFSADARIEDLSPKDCPENIIELDHWYSGISTLVGYEFKNRISVHCGYQLSFDLNGSHLKTQTISLGVGCRF